ncbi:hypothetical protein NQ317_014376 [Molorchus minor]|uniref:Uncharacterized protein n=1 Tax=Molorchus minor TaxID=1323400 RepID=A0ABQ9K5Q0_9CUCU|nr:hypothetical protein NQ317_014376 [Molorchus minor]
MLGRSQLSWPYTRFYSVNEESTLSAIFEKQQRLKNQQMKEIHRFTLAYCFCFPITESGI